MDPGLNNLYNIARDEIVNLNEMIRVANEFNEGRVKRAINRYIAASRGSGHMSSAPAASSRTYPLGPAHLSADESDDESEPGGLRSVRPEPISGMSSDFKVLPARKSGGKTKNSRKKKGGSTKRRRHRK